ncbi:MAG: TonB-dependent receptor [Verrucomicrobia subdivision 3 bacterium]|nr:TonB-dependent receptor [Limisphaerales bacterium]
MMKANSLAGGAAGVLLGLTLWGANGVLLAQTVTPHTIAGTIQIEAIEGIVEVAAAAPGAPQWRAAFKGRVLQPGDRVRTRELSRVTIRWSDRSIVRIGEKADFQIQAGPAPQQPSSFSLLSGILYFFNRDRLLNARYGTRTASAAIRGTEFVLQAEENGRTTLTVVEGDVELSNDAGELTLRTGEQGVAEPGQPPRKTPAIIINNIIQWALYYPAILDADEVGFTLEERERLRETLVAYKSGDLLQALDLLPGKDTPLPAGASTAERIYRAGLLLAVGAVDQSEALLNTIGARAASPAAVTIGRLADSTIQRFNDSTPPEAEAGGAAAVPDQSQRLADALRQLIAAVKLQQWQPGATPELASEWLAESYSHQSRADLPSALRSAKRSVETSADFGFGWARVAELEFSFGHTRQALEALDRSLQYSPRNAQALALKGFVLAAQNKIDAAIPWFHRAMEVDPALANAWLGRGLCLIRKGNLARGREDLLVAAALEPQRAILRSYLAKAYTDAGDETRATHELKIAKALDENDPTAWLYSALLNEQENRINEAVRDLEKSQELNDNRRIYRSGLLLDQDRAVRSANLARIYQDAGMFDVAVREAGRAVSYDYANYSAHLFLADSYNELVDVSAATVRFQTPKRIEYLLANLLAPVGGGILSPAISEQEYSKLFERDRFGVSSRTEYLSRGAWSEVGSQFGVFGNTSYALEAYYQSDPGQRINNDFEEREFVLHFKQQLTPADTVYALASLVDSEGGDLLQRYDPSASDPDFRFDVKQEPIAVMGYHREWHPGSHTLLMGTIYREDFGLHDPTRPEIIVSRIFGMLEGVPVINMANTLDVEREAYAAEAQHIFSGRKYHTIVGARYVWGDSDVRSRQDNPSDLHPFFPDPPEPAASQREVLDTERFSAYLYQQWEIVNSLRIFGGLTYDYLRIPANTLDAPISSEEETTSRVSPKAGVIWQPLSNSVVRLGYTRSLIGTATDQNLLIEPSQIAGFTQIYRSIFPESMVGSVPGARAETFGVSLEQKVGRSTFLSIGGEILTSEAERTRGVFDLFPFEALFAVPSSLQERLDYRERTLTLNANQLVMDEWSLGLRYRLSEAELNQKFPEIPPEFLPRVDVESVLHQLSMHVGYNHPSGFFSQLDAIWNAQSNHGYEPDQAGDSFWHFNAFAGYRFYRRKIELTVGVLNLLDEDYRLSPLNLHPNLPRERTAVARLTVSF